MYKVERRGPRKITTIADDHLETTFHETDNLDTKHIKSAEDNYEKTFIIIRKFLENNEQYCCDDKNDRLALCQGIVDSLRQGLVIRRG